MKTLVIILAILLLISVVFNVVLVIKNRILRAEEKFDVLVMHTMVSMTDSN